MSLAKLIKKYGNPGSPVSPLLPPPPDTEVDVVEVPVTSDEVPQEWTQLQEFDPLTEKPSQSKEEILAELPEEDIPPYEKELLKVLRPEYFAGQDAATKPPPRKKAKLTADQILKICTQFEQHYTKS